MKIVVTTVHSINGNHHIIEVVDGTTVVCKKSVKTIQQRDQAVWDLADMYNVVDIDVKSSKQDEEEADTFKFSEIPSIPVIDEYDAEYFFEEEKDFVYTRIIQAVKEGIELGLETVRLFELNGTNTYLSAHRPGWKAGLEKAIEYFVSVEKYEQCAEVQKMIEDLE